MTKDIIFIGQQQDTMPLWNRIKACAAQIGMNLVNQTKLITAASELARNMLQHGGGGVVSVEVVSKEWKQGIRLTFEDKGPGIANVDQAMKDGFSTAKGLGMGLPGARRLVSEFEIRTEVGKGTTVTVIKWKNG